LSRRKNQDYALTIFCMLNFTVGTIAHRVGCISNCNSLFDTYHLCVTPLQELTIMATRQPRYSKEEFAQRGDHIYQNEIRQKVEAGNHGKIVAIDIETGAFEVAESPMSAVDRLYEREPDAQPWVIRIGHRAVFRFGSRSLRKPV